MEKLEKKIEIKGKIRLLSGLHIGSSNSEMGIGGADHLIIRNPITGKPYIPGSSIKGKLRSLIEIADGKISVKIDKYDNKHYGVSDEPESVSSILFGFMSNNKSNKDKQRPSRLIFRDLNILSEDFKNTDLPYSEVKMENTIDRITARSENLRQIERVPAGAIFELAITINVFNNDDEAYILNNTKRALKLLNDDYLGGNGSRGYGQVKISIDKITSKSMKYYSNEAELIDLTNSFKWEE